VRVGAYWAEARSLARLLELGRPALRPLGAAELRAAVGRLPGAFRQERAAERAKPGTWICGLCKEPWLLDTPINKRARIGRLPVAG
jgi:hypothetical protein